MSQNKTNFAIPLAFVGMMFFAVGFALGIGSSLVPVLEGSFDISSMESNLIIAANFIPFLIFGYPASMVIRAIGYKRTMALSFVMFAIAFGLFIPSASQQSFSLFLVASFISGTANAFLQASVNPYITILGPIESAAKRMSIMGICNKLAWPIPGLFIVYLTGTEIADLKLSQLSEPFYIIIGASIILGIVALLAPLPEVKAAGEDEDEASSDKYSYATNKTSIWQFPHLLLGCLALFLYVGVETVSLSSLTGYAKDLNLASPEQYAFIAPVGMVIGYIFGIILIPKYLTQEKAMRICAVIGIIGSLVTIFLPPLYSIWAIFLVALGCSLMWPALWPLAMADLGKFTKAGASLLIMAIAGGAILPLLFGLLKDVAGPQNAYWINLPCFLFILYYGIAGYKIRTK